MGRVAGTLSQRYRLEEPLGRGGMGEVWRARDLTLDRTVAVKLLPAEHTSPTDRQRFLREARAAAQLSHPNVVAVYDTGEWEGRPYLIMELLEGRTLAEELAARGPLPVEEVRQLGAQIASALQAAHAAGVIHRDIKPDNLIKTVDGTLKVVDFGIAGVADVAVTRLTQTGMLVGTVAYLAPERLQGSEADARSDLYALGCVLYELLCGRPPYTGDVAKVLYGHVHAPPEPPSSLRPEVPPDLEGLLLALLAKQPADRPADAGEVCAVLLGGDTRRLPMGGVPPPAHTAVMRRPLGGRPTGHGRLGALRAHGADLARRAGRPPARALVAAAVALVLVAGGLLWYAGRDDGVPHAAATPTSSSAGRDPDGAKVDATPETETTRPSEPSEAEQGRRPGGQGPMPGSRAWLRLLDERLNELEPGVDIDTEVYEDLRELTDEALDAYADGDRKQLWRKLAKLSRELDDAQEDGRVVPKELLSQLDALTDLAGLGNGWKERLDSELWNGARWKERLRGED